LRSLEVLVVLLHKAVGRVVLGSPCRERRTQLLHYIDRISCCRHNLFAFPVLFHGSRRRRDWCGYPANNQGSFDGGAIFARASVRGNTASSCGVSPASSFRRGGSLLAHSSLPPINLYAADAFSSIGTMIRLMMLPRRRFRLPVYDASAVLGHCFAIQRKQEQSQQPQWVYRMNLEKAKSPVLGVHLR
jgi:hypothetical protein